jgi:hypothetical protein
LVLTIFKELYAERKLPLEPFDLAALILKCTQILLCFPVDVLGCSSGSSSVVIVVMVVVPEGEVDRRAHGFLIYYRTILLNPKPNLASVSPSSHTPRI